MVMVVGWSGMVVGLWERDGNKVGRAGGFPGWLRGACLAVGVRAAAGSQERWEGESPEQR